MFNLFFFSSRRRHTRFDCDWSSDVCSSDLIPLFSGWSQIYGVKAAAAAARAAEQRAHGMEQQVIFQVFDAYYGLRTASQRVRTSADLRASATQSEQVALGRYKAGAGSLLDLLTAQAALA